MNAVVLGAGRSGQAASALLRREGWNVTVLNGADQWPENGCDLCVTSPGISLEHPWQVSARSAGIPVISELQLGAERYRSLGGRMLAVTGSKGKSSVVKLVADALGGVPCGNYGTPLCEVVNDWVQNGDAVDGVPPWAVVEVSSFQMETTELPPDAFVAAAILNLQEDHLDRHGAVETYHSLKRRLLDFAECRIQWCDGSERKPDAELFAGGYFDNGILRDNAICAVRLMRAAGLCDDAIRSAFARFEPLPHRMQSIGTFGGVAWIDDSKATSIAALAAGVEMAASRIRTSTAKAVHLIAGGLPKGDDPNVAAECLSRCVRKAYLIGKSAESLQSAWSGIVQCEVCGTIERAVSSAMRNAESGECVLLSPGAASFDQFRSYGERGDRFKALVSELSQPR